MECSLAHEHAARSRGFSIIAGVDEAGRGPLAGPVVAAAVILPGNFTHPVLNDSKRLSPKKREVLYEEITGRSDIFWASAVVESPEIDRINILRATHQAMRAAVQRLSPRPDFVLMDGLPVPEFPVEQAAIVRGDAQSFSIAAASIVAKVTRDHIMMKLDREYPLYGFAKHKGYGTSSHLITLKKHGPSPHHRRSFLPVREAER